MVFKTTRFEYLDDGLDEVVVTGSWEDVLGSWEDVLGSCEADLDPWEIIFGS